MNKPVILSHKSRQTPIFMKYVGVETQKLNRMSIIFVLWIRFICLLILHMQDLHLEENKTFSADYTGVVGLYRGSRIIQR